MGHFAPTTCFIAWNFPGSVFTKEVEQALKAYLKSDGYQIIGGQLEVFPSGNALRLPLQAGFA